jgi:hypothetical protein
MTFRKLFIKLFPFIRPYTNIIVFTLLLTFVGSFTAQVNAFILKYTVDSISNLMMAKQPLREGFYLLTIISIILLGKEVIYSLVQFG